MKRYTYILGAIICGIPAMFVSTRAAATNFRTNPTICSITLEGDIEKQTFEKYLGTMNYNFVELTPQGDSKNDKQWFDNACKSDVQCDVLIVP